MQYSRTHAAKISELIADNVHVVLVGFLDDFIEFQLNVFLVVA